MLVNPRALSSSPTEHHPSSLTEPPCYFIKSCLTRLSFSWNTQYSLSQRSHPASGCCLSLLKHAHSCTVLIANGFGMLSCPLWTQRCWKHFPVLNLKMGIELSIRKLLQSFLFTVPGYYSEVFAHIHTNCITTF